MGAVGPSAKMVLEVTKAPVGGDGAWIKTQQLAKWIAEEVLRLGKGNKVIVVGHLHHVRRVATLLRYYGLNPVIHSDSLNIPYDSRDTNPGHQWWCKSQWRWYRLWEYASRAILILNALRNRL